MCGIAVAIGCENARALVSALLADLASRGDVTDPIVSPSADIAMGTRRLRIVDAEHGIQPQLSFDGRLLVSFNGEIYNHVALRHELAAMGVPFQTESDTEVLANALRIWGAGALKRLIGMYAFVALELHTGEFIAARDPFGVKPLYLVQEGAGYLFCSEIRPLLAATEVGDVMLIPPGHLLSRKVFAPFRSPITAHEAPAHPGSAAELDRLLHEAVERRMQTDLPVATLFSGGIDSTLIAHYARRIQPDAPGYFLGGETAPDYPFAAEYAERTGYDLRLTPFDADTLDAPDLMDRVVRTVEGFEPEIVRTGVCSYLLSQHIHRDGFRIALCGEGADELFAGYVHLEAAFSESDALGRSLREQCLASMHSTNLQRVDRCSMAFQLEVREPFLDPVIVNYAARLPGADLVRRVDGQLRGKLPLRELYDLYPEALPASIRDRRKSPLNEGTGFDRSHRDAPWKSLAEETITDGEFQDGLRQYAAFDLRTKEELMYLRKLHATMDVFRVPHLRARSRLAVPSDFAERHMQAFVV